MSIGTDAFWASLPQQYMPLSDVAHVEVPPAPIDE
jgi:hypothetical protein